MKGYVPLIPNLKTCDYSLTDLCYLQSAQCTGFKQESIHGCTEKAIQETNYSNGNPDPESNEFEGEDANTPIFNFIKQSL